MRYRIVEDSPKDTEICHIEIQTQAKTHAVGTVMEVVYEELQQA